MSRNPKPPPPPEPIRPPGPRPPHALLNEYAGTPVEREHAAMINEAMDPVDAIRQRCALAGHDVPGYPVEPVDVRKPNAA
jgi:hypothetical protein